jgi:prepilin signal peptidase PulO-like enzyme (type II secretory pathway)
VNKKCAEEFVTEIGSGLGAAIGYIAATNLNQLSLGDGVLVAIVAMTCWILSVKVRDIDQTIISVLRGLAGFLLGGIYANLNNRAENVIQEVFGALFSCFLVAGITWFLSHTFKR